MEVINPIASIGSLSDSKDCIAILSTLSVLGNRDGPFTSEKLDQLLSAKAHFVALLQAELPGYFQSVGGIDSKPDADAFAKQIQLVHSHFASAFQRYVIRKGDWMMEPADERRLRLATGHAIDSFAALVKWSYFQNETLKGTSWSELHALYYVAEQEGYHHQPLNLFGAASPYNPSILALYLRALVLDIFNPGSLSAAQIEISEGWLSAWCSDYTLETEFQPRSHLIHVDLAEHSGFHLVTPSVRGDTIRYLRADALRGQIEEVKNELRQGRPYQGPVTTFDLPVEDQAVLLSSIERVYNSILARSGNRIAERTQVEDRTVEVLLGFDAINARLESGDALAAISFTLEGDEPAATDAWNVHDFSDSGMGLLVDRSTGDVVPLNTLIAVRVAAGEPWAVGTIVRKLTNRVQGQTLIGIEMIANHALPVHLTRSAPGMPPGDQVAAIYLPGRDSDARRDFLVLRQSDLSPRSTFELSTSKQQFRLRVNRTMKKGTDWIAMRFEVDHKR